jgi:AraC-like DNA-binding protein
MTQTVRKILEIDGRDRLKPPPYMNGGGERRAIASVPTPIRSRVRLGAPRPPKAAPTTELSYSFRVIRPFLRALRTRTSFPSDVLHGLDALEPDDRVAISIAHQMLDAAVEFTGDADLGLKAAQECTKGEAGALDYAIMSASTIEGAITAASRFIRLVTDALDIRIDVRGDRVAALFENCVPLSRVAADFQLGGLYSVLASIWGSSDKVELSILLAHPAPADTSEYERTFPGATLRFGMPQYGFEFAASVLDTPLRSADANLHDLMRRHAERMLQELPQALPITRRVKGLIAEELAGGHPGCAHIATRLQVSPRTLERRLELEGTTFTRLLEEVREGLALRYVGGQDLPLCEVAMLLGFSQTTAFHRAFRRWTGQTPLQYRRSSRGEPA